MGNFPEEFLDWFYEVLCYTGYFTGSCTKEFGNLTAHVPKPQSVNPKPKVLDFCVFMGFI